MPDAALIQHEVNAGSICLVATCCALTFVSERFDESSSEVCGSKFPDPPLPLCLD